MTRQGLYDPDFEHDACGVGLVCRLDGRPSRAVVEQGLTALNRLAHRGAYGCDADTGDGAGVLVRVSDPFFRAAVMFALPPAGAYGVGMVFLTQDGPARRTQEELIVRTATDGGWRFLGWRTVPVEPSSLGRAAAETMPAIRQFFVAPAGHLGTVEAEPFSDALEDSLYLLRKRLEKAARMAGFPAEAFYLPSLSARTVVYKGMMLAEQIAPFYTDLAQPSFVSPFAIVHQRYSTNTFPSWRLAQPFRGLAHNGEINTIRGNRAWMRARESRLSSSRLGGALADLAPVLDADASDSASLDNVFELLVRAGRAPDHAMAMLIPAAWGKKYPMGPDLRGFHEFHAGLMEPWDGPAAVAFTDGLRVGACLDRNGLRPARYCVTTDGTLILASEAGVLDLDPARIREKGVLGPGRMLMAEFAAEGRPGRVERDREVKGRLARRRPYRRWVAENRIDLPGFPGEPSAASSAPLIDPVHLPHRQRLFGYTRDDVDILLAPMAVTGAEPVGSMGQDTPLAALSDRPQSLFAYFRQQFAQITNPPLDAIREELVMSLTTFIGNDPNILEESPVQARLLKLERPVFSHEDRRRLDEIETTGLRRAALDAVFDLPVSGAAPGDALAHGLARLEREAADAVRAGAGLLVVTDRKAGHAVAPIPAALAVAAVNRRLMADGARVSVGVVCETGEAREVAHIALLLGLGASAVYPWLALDTVIDLALRRQIPPDDKGNDIGPVTAVSGYMQALCHGLLKTMSKMGVSTLRGYRNAAAFEAVGLGPDVAERYFPDIVSRIGGADLARLERDVLRWHGQAKPYERTSENWPASASTRRHAAERLAAATLDDDLADPLPTGGLYRYRKDGERRLWTADAIALLQQAVRRGDYALYKKYAAWINQQSAAAITLRGLMAFRPDSARPPVPQDEIEPADVIMRRFVTGAMSFGSLSREAHETLAVAMNAIGTRSNCGEGGEDPDRRRPGADGGDRRSAIRQVASGRFGVTLEYLADADELQIKIAQGAKPGEGGQLPGHKVDAAIARVRHAVPGVTLISPPPHHDIYSIEDIAQLIHDLRCANSEADVSVKLASEAGVGTVAAGAVKAGADRVLIAGHDGGTGASPLSSIRHTGSPWEIGLAETQQTLARNHLRGRVRIQVDGQLRTGRDVAVAALLGADEFGFGTAPLVALGCVMARRCHVNDCPVGVATQNPAMRARFAGKPEHVVNFFRFVAEELREIMAELGYRSVREMTGEVERLAFAADAPAAAGRALDFGRLLHVPEGDARRYEGRAETAARPGGAAVPSLDERLFPALEAWFRGEGPNTAADRVANTDRSVGTRLSARIYAERGAGGLAEAEAFTVQLNGSAGQSFGAFAAPGLTLALTGEANDYAGKGLSGGRLVIRPPDDAAWPVADGAIAGNVCLFGATSGEAYFAGRAGERFAVRNSGATAVVEGVGDHGCEYMTGGIVAVLGPTGVNFGAGMSGGLAYILDDDGLFDSRCNLDTIDLDPLDDADAKTLRDLLERHAHLTGSAAARKLLSDWSRARARFVKVFPMEYRRAIGQMMAADAATPRLVGVFT